MNLIVQAILGILTGKAGEKIGSATSAAVQFGALAAAIAPLAYWLTGHKDEVFLTLSYGDLAFWSPIVGSLVFVIVRLVHRAEPPG